MKLVFATTNKGKLEELRALVADLPLEILSVREVGDLEVVEDGATFAENALKKAVAYRDRTGLAALADDTGLCVDALGGAPGVHSARYAGISDDAALSDAQARYRANNEKLLQALAGVPATRRTARFLSAICLAAPGREPVVVEGACEGRILEARRGQQGFGYDPLFELLGSDKTLAELSADEKNRVSHRGRAFELIRPRLEALVRAAG